MNRDDAKLSPKRSSVVEDSGILPEFKSGRVVVPCELERDVLLACIEESSPMSQREGVEL